MYSFSKIDCYCNCNYKYKKYYIDKVDRVKTEALEKGSQFHELMEFYITGKKFTVNTCFPEVIELFNKTVPKVDKLLNENELIGTEMKIIRDNFIGYIDLVLKDKNGKIVLYDFKTGNYIPRLSEQEQSLQHKVYFYLIPEAYKFNYWYVKRNKMVDVYNINYVQDFDSFLRQLVAVIESTTVFSRQQNKFCKWCQFYDECEKENFK